MTFGVVNYGIGIIYSVLSKEKLLDVQTKLINSFSCFNEVDKIILPGFGYFGKVTENLKKVKLIDPLNLVVVEKTSNFIYFVYNRLFYVPRN